MATNSVLAKLAVNISANTAQFNTALSKTQRDLSSFTGGITKMAGALGIAFSVQQISSFAIEVSRLSGEAKAVSAAFERLPNSTKLMMDLKVATGGTVSELGLMKRAVQASNFDISLEALPRLLEFATLRAQQTGQSVDYLVDSIVTGIGRKSKLILDNLGISAVQLTEALGGASAMASSIGDVADAVGRIAEENLKNMEAFSENASTKLQRLAASWENVKVAIGDAANSTGLLGASIDATVASFDVMASKDLTFLEKLNGLFGGIGGLSNAAVQDAVRKFKRITEEQEHQEQIIKQVDRAFKEFNGDIEAYGKAIETHIHRTELLAEFTKRLTQHEDDRITTLGELREVEKELNDLFNQTDITDRAKLKTTAAQILAIKERIKATEDLLKVEQQVALSQTAQRAMAGESVNGVTSLSGVGSTVPFDPKTAFANMEALRGASIETTTEISQNWIDLSGTVAGAIGSMAESLGGAIVGMEDFGSAIIKTFANFAKEFGSMLIASGIAALALDKLIVNPVAAIAAGAALVALAGAASASLQRSHAGMSGGRSAPGRTPSEMSLNIGGRIRGYDLAIVGEKESYRRGRMG